MSDIVVSFKAQGEQGLLKAIKLLDNAQKGLGNTQKKTTKTTQTLNAKMLELAGKYGSVDKAAKAAGVSSKIFRRALKGQATAINLVNAGLKKTNTSMGLFGTLSRRNADGSSNLALSFSTMRSKLLLVNFALGMGINQLAKFAQAAAKIEAMETAFNTLSGGSINAAVAIDKLGEATNGTLSNFDMFQQANNAMILGVTRNSDEMADLFGMAKKLGDALGRDTANSVESLVTGIGRQSRMMLDNLGIIVDTEKAYKDYASELKKNASALTDAEKKQAFMNATLTAARQKIKDLPEGISENNEAFQQFEASMSNLNESIGTAFLPLMTGLANAGTSLADSMDPDRIKAYAYAIGVVLVGAMAMYLKQLDMAAIKQSRTGIGLLVTGFGILVTELAIVSGILGTTEEDVKDVDSSVKDLTGTLGTVTTDPINQELQDFIDKMAEANQFLRFAANMIKTDIMEAFSEPLVKEVPFFGTETIKEAEEKIQKLRKQAAKFNAVWASIAQKKGATDPEAQKRKELAQGIEKQIEKLKEKIANETKEIQDAVDSVNLTAFLEKFEEVTGISGDLFEVGEAEVFEASLGSIIKTEEEFAAVLKQVRDRQEALNEEAIQTIVINVREKETLDKVTEAQKNNNNAGTKDKTIQDELQEAYSKTKDAQIALLKSKIDLGEAAFWAGDLNDKELAGLNAMIEKYNELIGTQEKAQTSFQKTLSSYAQNLNGLSNIASSLASVSKMEGRSQKELANLQYFSAIASTAAAAATVLADPELASKFPANVIAMGAVLAQGYAQVRSIRNALNEMGGSTGDGGGGGGGITDTTDAVVGQFAEGGYVGGRPHSQGGTIIEAERGEFVMSRNAVDSIGLETLNQMNKGGGAGNINISLSGNVLTRDFVEGELAESIKEAVRKGSDFGLS
jgi:hypothetical protein